MLGNIFRQAQLVEVATILSTLLKSGVPVHESLQITAQSVSNIVYKEAVARIVSPVLKGNTVSAFLDKRLFPPLFIQMVQVGEKSARMEQNLDFLAAFYQKEVQYRIKNILTLLEPFLLIIVGIAVLLLALAVLGPIYQIAGS
ncbi:type II secretion system F family protein [Candidatus Azambacteria bacterium]|nr:type II secretion system F family protein [Candidatus Azambacteria bacterium]